MTSTWALPTKLISTATIDATVSSFIDIIEMTRCSAKFARWQQKTVLKAFKWVDTMQCLVASIDARQLEVAMTKVRRTNVIFVDLHPQNVLLNPCFVLIKAVLSSPLLPVIHERVSILRCIYREAILRLGEEVTQKIFRDVTDACMNDKNSGDAANSKIRGVNVDDSATSNYEALYELPCDDVILASQLMLACYGLIKQSKDSLIPTETIAMIKNAAHSDKNSLKMLCIGLSSSSSAIYCASAPLSNSSSDFIPTSNPANTTTHISTNKPQTKIKISPSIDDFYNMTKNQQLWDIITEEATIDISRFLSFDVNFNTFQLLLREPSFTAIAIPSILSFLTDKVAGIDDSEDFSALEKKEEYTKYRNTIEVILTLAILREDSDEMIKMNNLLQVISTILRNSNKKVRLRYVG